MLPYTYILSWWHAQQQRHHILKQEPSQDNELTSRWWQPVNRKTSVSRSCWVKSSHSVITLASFEPFPSDGLIHPHYDDTALKEKKLANPPPSFEDIDWLIDFLQWCVMVSDSFLWLIQNLWAWLLLTGIAQWVKVLATQPEDLSSIPEAHRVGEKWLCMRPWL